MAVISYVTREYSSLNETKLILCLKHISHHKHEDEDLVRDNDLLSLLGHGVRLY